jgi:beta-lactamase regulating signal transducer with metallopeptidase domain/tetratricopeptide (TPR) repeat protein
MDSDAFGDAFAAMTAVVAVASGAAAAGHRLPAAVRNLLWRVGILAFWVVPLAVIAAAALEVQPTLIRVPVLPATPEAPPTSAVRGAVRPAEVARPVEAPMLPATRISVPEQGRPERPSLATVLVGVWVLGAGWAALRLGRATRTVRRLSRKSRPVADEDIASRVACWSARLKLRTPPRLLESDGVTVPAVIGVRRPVLLLPLSFPATEGAHEAVLVHELAHLARRDLLFHALAAVTCVLWWWHPLAWVVSIGTRSSAEDACDDWAVAQVGERHSYANLIVSWARAGVGAAGSACGFGGRALLRRVRRILEEGRRPLVGLSWPVRAALVASCLGVLSAVVWLRVRPVPADGRPGLLSYAQVRERCPFEVRPLSDLPQGYRLEGYQIEWVERTALQPQLPARQVVCASCRQRDSGNRFWVIEAAPFDSFGPYKNLYPILADSHFGIALGPDTWLSFVSSSPPEIVFVATSASKEAATEAARAAGLRFILVVDWQLDEAIRNGRWVEIADLAQAWEQREPNSLVPPFLLSEAKLRLGEEQAVWDAAEPLRQSLRHEVELYRVEGWTGNLTQRQAGNPIAWELQAAACTWCGFSGPDRRAVSAANRAMQLAPEDSFARLTRGRAYWAAGAYREAIQDYSRLVRLDAPLPNTQHPGWRSLCVGPGPARIEPSGLDQTLEDALTEGRWDEALDLAQAWQRREPEALTPALLAHEAYRRLGHEEQLWAVRRPLDEAHAQNVGTGRRAAVLDPMPAWAGLIVARHSASPVAWQLLSAAFCWAQGLVGGNEFDAMLEAADRAVQLAPADVALRVHRARVYAWKGHLDGGPDRQALQKAQEDCDEAIRLEPGNAEAYFVRSSTYPPSRELPAHWAAAIADCDRAVRANPRYAEAWHKKAYLCLGAGRRAEGVEAYRRLVELAPSLGLEETEEVAVARSRLKQLTTH